MTRYLSEEEPTGTPSITPEEAKEILKRIGINILPTRTELANAYADALLAKKRAKKRAKQESGRTLRGADLRSARRVPCTCGQDDGLHEWDCAISRASRTR